MIVEVRDLGLAAYVKLKGYSLLACENRVFRFECPENVSKSELEIEYANSCCRQHDSNVMFLRQMMSTIKQ